MIDLDSTIMMPSPIALDVTSEAPIDALAQALGKQAMAWSLERGGTVNDAHVVARQATALVRAESEGHGCVLVASQADRESLARSGVVTAWHGAMAIDGAGSLGDRPFVLDESARFYTLRSFSDELRLAQGLQALATRQVDAYPSKVIGPALDALFAHDAAAPKADASKPNAQRLATEHALTHGLTIVSGGPGTGKTTTLARMLACAWHANPSLTVGLAAPTGKATARMLQALGDAAQRMALDAPHLHTALKQGQTHRMRAATVHAWLRLNPQTGQAAHDSRTPWTVDWMVVDEASMLNLRLARMVVEALPPHARLVLLGDKDQLTAVEPGNVFAELASLAAWGDDTQGRQDPQSTRMSTSVARSIVTLHESRRFAADSAIGHLAGSVRDGDASVLDTLQRNEGTADAWAASVSSVHWTSPPTKQREGKALGFDGLGAEWHRWVDAFATPYAQAIQRALDAWSRPSMDAKARDELVQEALTALDASRFLAAARGGPWGLNALNGHLARAVRARLASRGAPRTRGGTFQAGDPVIVTRNDAGVGVVNGDVGVVMPPRPLAPASPSNDWTVPEGEGRGDMGHAHSSWQVAFGHSLRGDGAFGAGHCVALARLPRLDLAYAITVHQSQGSEFERVVLALPSPWLPVCTRELLYTGVTRAKVHAALVSDRSTLELAWRSPTQRLSGLASRLAGR